MRRLFCKHRLLYGGYPDSRGLRQSCRNFQQPKHSILFQFNQGEKLRAEIPNIEIEILGVADASSVILQVKDVKSGTVNDLLTPGRNLKISGNKIKVAGDNTANGIYFVNADTNDRIQVEESDVVVNNPYELIVIIPAISAGAYKLEVVTQYAGGNTLKEPRTAEFDKILTVS